MKLPKQSAEVRDALVVYGYALVASRRYEAARALYSGMSVLFPEDRYVSVSLAVASLACGASADALALADDLMASASAEERSILDFVRGKALFAAGRGEEARDAFLRGLAPRASGEAPASRGAV